MAGVIARVMLHAMLAGASFLFGVDAMAAPATLRGDAVKSAGCSTVTSNAEMRTALDGKGRSRSYLVKVPKDYEQSHPYSVIFVMHGAFGTAQGEAAGGLRAVGDAAANAIFVYPQGIQFKNYGIGWDDTANGYDMPLFDSILADVSATYCMDSTRVFAEGFSWGGDFVTALACARGDKIRAVVAMSTTDEYGSKDEYKTYWNYPCPGKKHPAVLFTHAVDGDNAYPAPLFETTSKLFKYLNSCGTQGHVVPSETKVMACVTYDSCSTRYMECFVEHRVGHAPPPNWAETAWSFLSTF